ncbi:AAA family ATPase [Methylobacterium sp. GXS13]|uniref:AAA family ATPase n=1 Tax=Methylobacterium sp. GXS13 TaxID=1730094 RepID=UPI000AC85963|nr:AAA family ATPase [Methylobacterium sp. GXS13]
MSAPTVPPKLARRIVLRHLPRLLRAGLDEDGIFGRVPVALALDAGALDAGLGGALAHWAEQGPIQNWPDHPAPDDEEAGAPRGPRAILGRFLRRTRRRSLAPAPGGRQPDVSAEVVALLDRFSAGNDCMAAREIADAVLILSTPPTNRTVATRLAAAAWRDLERVDETADILRVMDLAAAFDDDDDDFVQADAGRLPAASDGEAADALRRAWHEAVDAAMVEVRVQVNALALGLSAIAVGEAPRHHGNERIGGVALRFGEDALQPVERRARAAERKRLDREATVRSSRLDALKGKEAEPDEDVGVPDGHVLVCRALGTTGSGKGKDVTKGYEKAIGRPLPLVRTPNLAVVRKALLAEFPQAGDAIDFILRDLVGRTYVRLAPLLILGPPGSGKSRFARRLGETLGIGILRVDGSNDGGASFGGTERRWYSSEPCRPFMAVNRFLQANPFVLVDEVDKAPTRSDYGRLWDGIISFLEPETAVRFPDPCVQAELDLSWVSVVATANVDWTLPAPLLDRLRVVDFAMPRASHLEGLLPALLDQVAAERGLDPRWFPPLDAVETMALRRSWRGGSVRRLRRMLDGVLRVRAGARLHH